MVWAFLSPQLEHVNEFEHDWSLNDDQLRGARYTLKLRRGSATAAEADGAQLAELSPHFALLRALRQATARAAHWWTITAEPALCAVPCEITPARVRRAMPIFYGNPRVGSLGQPSPEGDWGEVATLPVPHTRGRWAGQPSSVTFGSFAAATNTDIASALVNWAASSVFELQAEVDFELDRGKRGRACERTCDMRRKSRAARTMPDSLLQAKLAAMAKLVQRTLEPWGVLVRLDGGAEAGEEAGRVTDYFGRLEARRRGEYLDDEHGGLYKAFTEAQLRSFYLNADDDEPVLPENGDGENYQYNYFAVMISQLGTGALDAETESIAACSEEGSDGEEEMEAEQHAKERKAKKKKKKKKKGQGGGGGAGPSQEPEGEEAEAVAAAEGEEVAAAEEAELAAALQESVRLEEERWVAEEQPPQPEVPSREEEAPASDFICPITTEVMSDPVMAADGHSYERKQIGRWLATKSTSPMTGEALEHSFLTPNHALRGRIREWQEAY